MKALLLTLLYNRHTLIERVVRCFIDQDYNGECTLFIYNTGENQELGKIDLPANKKIVLVQKNTFSNTGMSYESVGDKYRDALELIVSEQADIVNMTDSDDLFLPNHISEGVRGMEMALNEGKVAFKPKQSFLRTRDNISLHENNFEGSIFMTYSHLVKHGFAAKTVTYHQQWLDPLIANGEILVGKDATPTWIYTWGEEIPTWKTSGGKDDYDNFLSTQVNSKDVGDIVIDPVSKEEIEKYYVEAKSVENK